MIDKATPLWQLTLGDLLDALNEQKKDYSSFSDKEREILKSSKKIYGLKELSQLLGCSVNHASKLKSKGVFNGAFIQRKKLIIFDEKKVLELFDERNRRL